MGKRVSLKDIAAKVGVSTALVSYVINGLEKEKRVGPEIVKKIREVARELNYKPNQIARSLRKGSTNTIGLIVADIANPFFGQLARIIEDEAARHHYTVIIGSSDENCVKSAALIEALLDRQVDGFIIVPSEGCNASIETLVQREVPVVLVDRFLPDVNANYIVLDNFKATYEAVTHFVAKGCERIAFVAYQSSLVHMQERIRGYRQAMKDHQLEEAIQVKELLYNHAKDFMDNGVSELLTGNQKPDALLFATNALSISGLYAIKNHNIKVPEDMAVIGFDGNEVFDFFYSPLTYIEQPIDQMGKESVRILMEQIKGNHQTVQIELQHRLIQRQSCG
ncbi:MAG TPA: LacI family transcriptional regulator [Prolixibacteraceae bacterium]|jgi:LacI family transcriptional regulator|nr:LacI family transcriptional regulator [Prolixibacteraceae bacterium]